MRQAGEDHEIEITDEMAEAGAIELLDADMRFESPENVARSVFAAMISRQAIRVALLIRDESRADLDTQPVRDVENG